jgi:ElaB/YqjD/DUF883 family membrane-anchored ribosome-binding protein
MPPETELIKQQMGQTRAALADKLENLESKVFGIVTTTTDTVTQTVQGVQATVTQTVQEVGATLRDTTQSFHAATSDVMTALHNAFDVPRQVHNHPWLTLGSSVLAGYVGGVILDNLEHGHMPSLPSLPAGPEKLLPRSSEVRGRMEAAAPARNSGPSFLKSLFETFAPEIDKLKAAAVGMALGVVRDRVGESVPQGMREDFTQMMDRITAKLGGEPHPPGAMLGAYEKLEEDDGAGMSRSMGRG